jgi:enoyl-CoA hydratase/carnithine racemase
MISLSEARKILADLSKRTTPRGGRVTLASDGALATIQLDAPAARNAIDSGMMVQLADAVTELGRFDGAAVMLSSVGPVFCSGGHLGDVGERLVDHGLEMAMAMTAVLDGLLALPLVSVAAVSGPALGGGTEIATACDFRIVSPNARFSFVQARLGVAPGWGGGRRLALHVGRGVALRWLTSAADISAEASVASGFAERVADDPEPAARAFLAPTLALPVASVRAIKRQLHDAPRDDDREAWAFATVWGGATHRDALAAPKKSRGES